MVYSIHALFGLQDLWDIVSIGYVDPTLQEKEVYARTDESSQGPTQKRQECYFLPLSRIGQ